MRVFLCPSRRFPGLQNYRNAGFPAQGAVATHPYSAVYGATFSVGPNDYAACNGNAPPTGALSTTGTPGSGIVLSQIAGRKTVNSSQIADGASYTILISEKAVRWPSGAGTTNEDDAGYASAFSSINYNTVRFTSSGLLPIRDNDVSAVTNGGFG